MQEAGSRLQHVMPDSATAGGGFGAASSAEETPVSEVNDCLDTMQQQQQQIAHVPTLTLSAFVNPGLEHCYLPVVLGLVCKAA